jgi:hypothetical protein
VIVGGDSGLVGSLGTSIAYVDVGAEAAEAGDDMLSFDFLRFPSFATNWSGLKP